MNICHQESNSSHETSFNKNLPLEKLHKFVANRICEPFNCTPLLLLILPFLGLSYQKALSYKKARRAYGTYRFIYKLCNLITVIACAYQVKTIKGTLYQHHTSNFLRTWFHHLHHPWMYFFVHNDYTFHRDIGNSSYANFFGEIKCIMGNVSACGNFIVNSLNSNKKL